MIVSSFSVHRASLPFPCLPSLASLFLFPLLRIHSIVQEYQVLATCLHLLITCWFTLWNQLQEILGTGSFYLSLIVTLVISLFLTHLTIFTIFKSLAKERVSLPPNSRGQRAKSPTGGKENHANLLSVKARKPRIFSNFFSIFQTFQNTVWYGTTHTERYNTSICFHYFLWFWVRLRLIEKRSRSPAPESW